MDDHPQDEGLDARAFWLRSPGHGEIRPAALPDPGPDDVLVRTACTGVSRGTETLVFRGGVPAGQYASMRAPFQEGAFPGPVKYGYLRARLRSVQEAWRRGLGPGRVAGPPRVSRRSMTSVASPVTTRPNPPTPKA
jgi:hypothetical protein